MGRSTELELAMSVHSGLFTYIQNVNSWPSSLGSHLTAVNLQVQILSDVC